MPWSSSTSQGPSISYELRCQSWSSSWRCGKAAFDAIWRLRSRQDPANMSAILSAVSWRCNDWGWSRVTDPNSFMGRPRMYGKPPCAAKGFAMCTWPLALAKSCLLSHYANFRPALTAKSLAYSYESRFDGDCLALQNWARQVVIWLKRSLPLVALPAWMPCSAI